MTTPRPSFTRRTGFTLVEILVAIGIMGFAVAGAVTFMGQAQKTYYYDTSRLLLNADMRKFTQQMTTNAVFANYFLIYPNFQTRSVTTTTGNVTTTVDANVNDGMPGDFLVLVSGDTDAVTGKTTINQLVGYYRDPNDPTSATSTGPVRTFNINLSPAVDPTATPVWSLLNTYVPTTTAHTNPIVIQLAQGLAGTTSVTGNTTSNSCLFYNFYDRSVMIKGQIIEQNGLNRKAVNTYNFTVSPRG